MSEQSPPRTRPISEIMDSAIGELEERETRLVRLIEPAKEELAQVRRAIKRLENAAGTRSSANGNGSAAAQPPRSRAGSSMEPAEKRERLQKVLDENAEGDPLTTAELAKQAGVSPQGLHFLLGHMKREGIVAEPEGGRWLSTKAPRFDTSRRDPDPEAA